jgi:hypothetical protein
MLMIFDLLFIADTLAQIRAPLLQTLQEMKILRGIGGGGRGNFDLFDLPFCFTGQIRHACTIHNQMSARIIDWQYYFGGGIPGLNCDS